MPFRIVRPGVDVDRIRDAEPCRVDRVLDVLLEAKLVLQDRGVSRCVDHPPRGHLAAVSLAVDDYGVIAAVLAELDVLDFRRVEHLIAQLDVSRGERVLPMSAVALLRRYGWAGSGPP